MTETGPKRVMFYVQHLLGVGHVRRAELISTALANAGFQVHMVLGGVDVPGIDFSGAVIHRLPAARAADTSFSTIIDGDGSPISDQWREGRRELLLDLFQTIRPEILLIEQFPFGRRQFRFELIDLLDAATSCDRSVRVACSVRDMLVKKNNPKRTQETVDIIDRYFDRILVHGDESFLPFDASFDGADCIADKLIYTGYVTPPSPPDSETGKNEIIVATGGGAVGGSLLVTAIASKPLSVLRDYVWRILIGPNVPPEVLNKIKSESDAGIIIEPNRRDYLTLLSNCKLSISQAGYNTLMDIVTANCPALVVPFAEAGETEQMARAQRLAQAGSIALLPPIDLTAQSLAERIDLISMENQHPISPFRVNGAVETAQLLKLM